MLSNAYFLAKFRFDTAENEPAKNLQNFANFPNFANQLSKKVGGRRSPLRRPRAGLEARRLRDRLRGGRLWPRRPADVREDEAELHPRRLGGRRVS